MHFKTCKYCGNNYITPIPHSKFCDDCRYKRKNKKIDHAKHIERGFCKAKTKGGLVCCHKAIVGGFCSYHIPKKGVKNLSFK